jgi:hypothetical protein
VFHIILTINSYYISISGPGSSVGIATDYWTVRGSNSGGARFSALPDRPWSPPSPHCTMGTRSFSGVKYGRGVLLTTHLLLVLRSGKSRAMPLPTLWATTGPVTETLYIYLCVVVSCTCCWPKLPKYAIDEKWIYRVLNVVFALTTNIHVYWQLIITCA